MKVEKNTKIAELPIFEPLEARMLFSSSLLMPSSALLAKSSDAITPAVVKASTTKHKISSTAPVGTGLSGEYFSAGQAYLLRTDSTISLAPKLATDKAGSLANAITWTGEIVPNYSEPYSFSTSSLGGVQLWVNGQVLINQPTLVKGLARSTQKINLVAGQQYSITLKYTRNGAKNISIKLLWASQHQKQAVVPQPALFPQAGITLPATNAGLIGQYYIGTNFNQQVMARVDPTININFGTSTPGVVFPNRSSFSIRWAGQIQTPTSGTYKFLTTSDDGVRLYIDGNLLINDWNDHLATVDTASIALQAGHEYDIRLDYYQDVGLASIELQWSGPGVPLQIVPASAFSSTPPASAGTLSAVANGTSEIDLSWTGSAAATGYNILQSLDGGTTWTTIASTAAGVTSYDVTNLSPGTQYSFRVAPLGSAYTSTPSNTDQVGTVTSGPLNLTGQPNPDGTTALNWSDVTGENGFVVLESSGLQSTPEDEFGIRPDDVSDSQSFTPIATLPTGTTSYSITGLTPGDDYQFEVEALNAQGIPSAPSNSVATTSVASTVPDVMSAVAGTDSVVLNWVDVPSETGFAIDRSTSPTDGFTQIATVDQGITTYTDTGLLAGTGYFYRIRTLDAGGSSDPSDVAAAVTLLPAPGSGAATINSDTDLLLDWADVPNETGFDILESDNNGATFNPIGQTTEGVTSFPVTGLAGGSDYQFAIESVNSAGVPSVMGTPILATTLPTAPAVTVTPLSTTQLSIAWPSVDGATGYIVERSPNNGSWSTIATLPGTASTYVDTGLLAGTANFYRVTAVDSQGDSLASAVVEGATLLDAPSNVVSSAVSATQLVLNWGDVAAEHGFAVLDSIDGGLTFNQIGTTAAGITTFTATGLTGGSNYRFAVQSLNAVGNPSAASTPAAVITPTIAPGAVTATPLSTTQNLLSWSNVPGETGFILERSLTGTAGWTTIATPAAGVTTFTDTSLLPDTAYFYRVIGVDAGGNSAPSAVAQTVTLINAPSTVTTTGLAATQLVLNWADVSNENGFAVLESIDGGNTFLPIGTTPAGVTTFTATGLTGGSGYQFVVKALNSAGIPSTPSTAAIVTTPTIAPAAITATPFSSTQNVLSWSDVAGETGFAIQRSLNGITGWNTIATPTTGTTTYTDSGLTPGVSYFYRVAGTDAGGSSVPSTTASAVTLTNAPASITGTSLLATQLLLNWADVSNENGFAVLESPNGANHFSQLGTTLAGILSLPVTGLVGGTAYQFEIESKNAAGLLSAPSAPVTLTTPTVAPATLTAVTYSSTQTVLTWSDVAGETGFKIERSLDGITSWTTIATPAQSVLTYTDSSLSPGVGYFYRVSGTNPGGNSIPSLVASAVTLTNAPASVTGTGLLATQLILNWADVAHENGFAVLESSNGGISFNQIGTTPVGITAFPVIGLVGGSAYPFEVRALNSAGQLSVPSTPVTLTIPTVAPATLTAVPYSSTQNVLTWTDVAGETGFAVQRSLDGITNWATIATPAQGVLTYTDSGLSPGVAYFYRVSGTNSGGSSIPSLVATSVTLVNAPSTIATASLLATQLILNWTDVTNENGFAILESTDGVHFTQIGTTPAGVTTFPVLGLTAATPYQFAIKAWNSVGAPSAASTPLLVTTPTIAPATLAALPLSASSAQLTWSNVTGETGFTLERSLTGIGAWSTVANVSAGTLTYTDTTLGGGITYFYRVHGNDAGGPSLPSPIATVLTLPSAPVAALTGLSVSQSQVSWPAVIGATSYLIERSANGSTNWTTAATAIASATSAVVANLAPSTVYYYRVSAINASGTSTPSAVVSQMTAPLATYVTRTQIFGVTAGSAIYNLNMTAGTSTPIGQLLSGATDVERDPITGLFFYYKGTVSPQQVYNWDPTTGNNTLLDTSNLGTASVDASFRPDGTIFIVGGNSNLYSVAPDNGAVTNIAPLKLAGAAFTPGTGDLCFAPNGTLFLTSNGSLYTVNTSTAAVTLLAPLGLGNVSMVFGQNSTPYMTNPAGQEYSLNLTSLVATLLNNPNVPSFTSLTADPIFTSLTLTATASPTAFTPGSPASYALVLSNPTGDATAQPITITTTLPTGLTYTSATGTGWTASVSGQVVTLTYINGVAAGATLPTVTLNVAVASSAIPLVTTTFTATGQDFDKNTTSGIAIAATVVL